MKNINIRRTRHEFAEGKFVDDNNIPCSIQKSMKPGNYIWLGIDGTQIHYVGDKMLLSQDTVTMLLPLLQQFAETGELPLSINLSPIISSNNTKLVNKDNIQWVDKFNDINPASTDNNRNTDTPKQYLNTKISKPENQLPPKNDDLFLIVCNKLGKILEDFGCDSKFIDAHNHIVNDLGLDSLDCVELAMALEDEFDIIILDEDAEKLFIVKDIVNYILKRTVHKDQVGLVVAPGYLIGYWNRLDGKPALYISGDELGADSNQQKEYIDGYIKGYNN